jgi:hypothetical protein
MTILAMPDVLRWMAPEQTTNQAHDTYLDLLAEKMGEILGGICREATPLGEELRAAADHASNEGFMRILSAPETCACLLAANGEGYQAKGQFLRRSFLAETLREGQRVDTDQEVWTALGDMKLSPDGTQYCWPQIEELTPLDFGSPYATKVDLSGADRELVPSRPPFTEHEMEELVARLRNAHTSIQKTSPRVAAFVSTFNKVLVLQKDTESLFKFASGSNGHYIGRSFLANPHLPGVDEALIADAIVHEGIHGLLYMQEQTEPWFPDPAAKRSLPRVTSAWTGSSLSLASFLQACFVWYGLLHFWSLALTSKAFDNNSALKRFRLSVCGFLGKPLRGRVSQFSSMINPGVLDTIDEMQDVVSTAFSSI